MSSHTHNKNKNVNDENDTLAELDEYLKDDSNGQILAQFIQQKLGAPRSKESLFAGFPLPDFKVNVKLTKCAEKQPVSTDVIGNQEPLKDLTNGIANKNDSALVSATPVMSEAVVLPVEKEAVTVPTVVASTSKSALAAAALAVAQEVAPATMAVIDTQGTAPVLINAAPAAIEPSSINSLKPTTQQQIGSPTRQQQIGSPTRQQQIGSPTTQQQVGIPTLNVLSPQEYETVPQNSPSRSPRSALRRSGSCADSLRRSAIKRRRRQLFPDLEDSPINFAPIVFSTPSLGMLTGATNNAGLLANQHNHVDSCQMDREDATRTSSNITTTSNCSSNMNSHNVMVDLQRRDGELRNMIQEMLDRTIEKALETKYNSTNSLPSAMQPSASAEPNQSRTYTIEKCSSPGRIVLVAAAEKTVDKTLFNKKSVIRLRKINTMVNQTSHPTIDVDADNNDTLVPATPPPKTKTLINISTAAARENVEIIIPETQEVIEKTNGPGERLNQSGGTSVMIRPVCCQAFYSPKGTQQQSNVTANDVVANTNTEDVAVAKATASSTGTQSKCNTDLANKKDILTNKSIQTTIVCNEDNANDLLTEDESSDDVDVVLRNNSTAPLNLAPSGSVSIRQRLRAKANNPKRGFVCALNLRSNHYAEGVSQDNKKRNKIPPLNKAPNEPINGERFAMELARMTYNEIVDLRKRNSLGKVFPICGRRSSTLEKSTIIANQKQLELDIVREILRREMSGRQSRSSNRRVDTTIGSSQEQPLPEASLLAAPFGFEDSQRHSEVNSMARPSSRKSRTSSRSSRYINNKSQVIKLTDTLKNYIDAKCKVKDRRVSERSVSTKRNLYSKGDSIIQIKSSSSSSSSSSDGMQSEIEIVHSPPPRTFKPVEVTGLVIVSPPPPLYQYENEAMPAPPPQFRLTNGKSVQNQCEVDQEIDCNVNDNAAHITSVLHSSNHRLSSRVSKTQSVHQEQEMGIETSDADDNCAPMQTQTRLTIRSSKKGQKEVQNQMETNNNNINNDEDNVDFELPQNKTRLTRTLTKTQSEDKLEMVEEQNRKTSIVGNKDKQEELKNKSHKGIKRKAGPAARKKIKLPKTKESEMENSKDSIAMESLRVLTLSPSMVTEKAAVSEASDEPVAVQVELVAAHSTTTSPTCNIIDDGETASTSQAAAAKRSQLKLAAAPAINDDSVFKKPTQPAPKKTRTRKKQPTVVLDEENDTTIRRSKRGHIPLKNNWSFQQSGQSVPLFQYLYEQQMKKCMEQAKKRRENETLKSRMLLSLQNAKPICSSTPLYATESSEPTNKQKNPLCYGPQSLTNSSSETKLGRKRTRRQTKQLSVISELPSASPGPAPSNPPNAVGNKNKTQANKTQANKTQANKTQANKTPANKMNKTKKNQKKTNKKDDANRQENTNKEAPEVTVEELNNMFDSVRAASFCEDQQVETERQQPEEHSDGNEIAHAENAASNPVEFGQQLPRTQSKDSRNELIAWLKGVTETQAASHQSCEMFEGMHISSRGNLVFTDLEGIDYAFYETDDLFCLGYMRFKPLQSRPMKRARDFILHFIVLSGEFVIGTSTLDSTRIERRTLGPGDMATINKGARYNIENTLNDISILMVIKK